MDTLYSKEGTERGRTLIAYLAYPSKKELEERNLLISTLYVLIISQKAQMDPSWSETLHMLWPAPLLLENKLVEKSLKKLQNRLIQRATAGRMAMAYVKQYFQGGKFEYPEGLTGLSIDKLSNFVLPDTTESHANNIENRIWRKSLPVLHLAAAAQITLHAMEQLSPELYQTSGLFGIFHNPEYLSIFEKSILACRHALVEGKAPISANRLIDIGK